MSNDGGDHHATSVRITGDDLAATANERIRVGRRDLRRVGDEPASPRVAWVLGLCVLLLACSLTAAIALVVGVGGPRGSNVVRHGESIPKGLEGGIADVESLSVGVATLHVSTGGGLLASTGQGSAGVWSRDAAGRVQLVTNLHCLLLDQVGSRDYEVSVVFRDGWQMRVSRMAVPDRNIDLAILEIESAPGDVIVLPRTSIAWDALEPGSDVIAVGSPLGLEDTYTFGRVSARREGGALGYTGKWMQIDANLWPGSSGGPVFTAGPEGWSWAGVATAIGPMDVRFAIHVEEVTDGGFIWFDADAKGAREAARHVRSLR